MEITASLVSVWMVFTRASICLVAAEERSARRCTSSATTAKPRPASPAMDAWIAAFRARMLVWSAMSLIRLTMSPISWDDSPRRLIRFEVSWICSRMLSMPVMVLCTTSLPLLAMATERSATAEDSEAFADTWSMDTAISLIAAEAPAISWAWCSEASARCMAVAWVSWAAPATCTAVWLMVSTRSRSWSME
ncbi:hypothetical protein D3C80_1494830 [compost metagenome]